VLDADGNSILLDPPGPVRGEVAVGRPVTAIVGSDQIFPLAITLANLEFQKPGTYEVVARLNGLDAVRSPFNVIELSGMPGAAAPALPCLGRELAADPSGRLPSARLPAAAPRGSGRSDAARSQPRRGAAGGRLASVRPGGS